MNILDVILIAIALSMDACAITISNCTAYKCDLDGKKEWSMPIAFAVFQALMPFFGYLLGSLFSSFIGSFAGFLTAGIFFFLSMNIFLDVREKDQKLCPIKNKNCKKNNSFTFAVLLLQGLATSIDALAVGITFINLTFSIFLAMLAIALITAVLVSLALIFGKKLGALFGKHSGWIGAGLLFLLAVKSLVQAIIEIV